MKQLNPFLCLLLLVILLGPLRAQQACSPAFASVEEARRLAVKKDREGAMNLLRRAQQECPRYNKALFDSIAKVYTFLGHPEFGSPYGKAALAVTAKSYVRRKFALLVGVGKFQQSGRIKPLLYAGKDAIDLGQFLLDPAAGRFDRANVRIRTDEDASLENVKTDMEWIATNATEDDLVVLYFSTHGSKPSSDKSKNQSGYLMMHNTDRGRLFATALGMDELSHFFARKLRAQRVVVFLDTCYSGDAARQFDGSKALEESSIPAEAIDALIRAPVAQGKGLVVVTSSDGDELSWESDERKNSFFTLQLLDALRTGNGLASMQDVYASLQSRLPAAVEDYTRRHKKGTEGSGASQHPRIFPASNIPHIVIGTPEEMAAISSTGIGRQP